METVKLEPGMYVKTPNPLGAIIPDANPFDYGVITRIDEDGDIFVVFPIGKDDPREHSQCAPYKSSEIAVVSKETAIRNLPEVWANIDPALLIDL